MGEVDAHCSCFSVQTRDQNRPSHSEWLRQGIVVVVVVVVAVVVVVVVVLCFAWHDEASINLGYMGFALPGTCLTFKRKVDHSL